MLESKSVDAGLSQKEFSIVIPSFNRNWCIERALFSAVEFLKYQNDSEIIVVDDGSLDETLKTVENFFRNFQKQYNQITFDLICHASNKGVCAAKNTGARHAKGKWLIFLDSDDELLQSSFNDVRNSLESNGDLPLHFYRCINEMSSIVLNSLECERRSFLAYLKFGTDGEALPVVKRDVFLAFPYDEDIAGYESLSYMRIAKKYGSVCIHNVVARRYYVTHSDRLSEVANMKRRSQSLAKGHLRVLSEHHSKMSFFILMKYVLKFLKMKFISIV